MKATKKLKPWKPEAGEKFELVTEGNASVKVYRRAREKITGDTRFVFEVCDYTTGTRRMHSFSKLERARAKAKQVAEKTASGNVEAAAMTSAEAAAYGRSVELVRETGFTLETAADLFAKAHKAVGDRILEACLYFNQHRADQIDPRTVNEAITELLEMRKARGKSERYIDDLSTRLSRFAKDFAVDVAAISTSDVQAWLDKLPLSARSVKNYQGALGTLFKHCEARGYLAKGQNPVSDTKRVTTNGSGAIEIYTPKEIADLLANANKDFLPMVALGAFAGLRSAEIGRLDWKDIDLAGGLIHVAAEKAKTRSRRLVPVLPNLAQWLAPYATQRGKVWNGAEKTMRRTRAATVKAAGVAWKDNGLRHSFISYRLAVIQNAAQVALEAGNSPAMVFRHYRELVKPEAAKAWFGVGPEQPVNVLAMKEAAQ